MAWLQRHAWWGLLAIAAAFAASGVIDLVSGVTWQAWDVTGVTLAQIAAESGAGSRLSDFGVRSDGLHLIAFGMVVGAILWFAFRQDRPWAWWVMWAIPVTLFASSLLTLAFGAWGPATSGTFVGAVAVAILLITAPRFLTRSPRR